MATLSLPGASRVWRLVPWVCCALLAGLSFAQWRHAAQLAREVEGCLAGSALGGGATFEPLRPGKTVPAFSARSVEGEVLEVAARGQGPSLLLIYDPSCSACEAALPTWARLFARLRAAGSRAAVVGLSVADSYSTVQHARGHALPFPVVPFPDRGLIAAYGVGAIPVAVLVDNEGRVSALWDRPLDRGETGDVLGLLCPQCLGFTTDAKPVSD